MELVRQEAKKVNDFYMGAHEIPPAQTNNRACTLMKPEIEATAVQRLQQLSAQLPRVRQSQSIGILNRM